MIALRILDIKKFMSAFLIGSFLDDYALIEAQITTFCTFSIDGRLEREFFSDPQNEAFSFDPAKETADSGNLHEPVEYVSWRHVKERCFDAIKGKRTPLSFKFVFFYPGVRLSGFLASHDITVKPELVLGLCLNLRYDGTNLLLTTGTSMKAFTADRSADQAWDREVSRLIEALEIRTDLL